MNKYIKTTLAVGFATIALTACEDLDTEPKGRYITEESKKETLEVNPQMADAGIAGMAATVNQFGAIAGTDTHNDFGYASVMLGSECQGQDMVNAYIGYNWFRNWSCWTSPTPSGYPTTYAWYNFYKQIFASNSVLNSIDADTENPDLQFYRAQACMTRAFDYWNLAQYYQFNYKGHENSPCLPIVTNENALEVEQKGAPRATVQEVYDQILKDATEAIDLLTASGKSPEQMTTSKPKRFGSLATAYGMRARVYLTMHKYAEAAADAASAIQNFDGAPLSLAAAYRPGFVDIASSNWMWGIPVNESDRVVTTGICNWPSMANTLISNTYAEVGAWRSINVALYNYIPKTDVRKGWWLDENLHSDMLNKEEAAFIAAKGGDIDPYTNVKFGPYQGVVGNTTHAEDIPLMRIEEMYYIQAEGLAMSGNVNEGVLALTNFVKTYRDPNYAFMANSAEDVQNEVWMQRRVEFWGEGVSWFDLMRLDKPVVRTGTNWDTSSSFNIPASTGNMDHAKIRIYCIPQGEINGNKALSESDNNPSGVRPSPATWTEY